MLRSDIAELFDGFEQRMKFINIIRSLTVSDRILPKEIRDMTNGDIDFIDNMILAVVLFIRERTLSDSERCTMSDIVDFLNNCRSIFPEEYEIDTNIFARFIVVKVLQNDGKLYEYDSYYEKGYMSKKMLVTLIREEKGSYSLHDDLFEFLFKSKEIESELDYSVARFKLQEHFKRHNYKEAVGQSKELLYKLRNMRDSMNDFLRRCRENITRITADEYEKIVGEFRNLINSEREELEKLMQSAEKEADDIRTVIKEGSDSEELISNYKALTEITKNLESTIEEQRALINQKNNLSQSYEQIVRNSFALKRFDRMNFEKEIINPLAKLDMNNAIGLILDFLTPLHKPSFEHLFSIESFYEAYGKIGEDDRENGIDISTEGDPNIILVQERNTRYRGILGSFFKYCSENKSFFVKDYIKSLKSEDVISWSRENSLPNTMLTLFSLQQLNIDLIKAKTDAVITEPNGELDILAYMPDIKNYINMSCIKFYDKSNEICSFFVDDGENRNRIEMTNFYVEVID